MKLPFDLGVKFVLRLIIPGFLATLGLYPGLATLRDKAGWEISTEYLFILGVFAAGWLIIILDQPIYMVYEGRRFWPSWLRRLFLLLESKRLRRTHWKEDAFFALASPSQSSGLKGTSNFQTHVEASVELRKFPLDDQGHPAAKYPSRLGNLITSYETYPDTRYGMDAIFYWYRIWPHLEKDLREELDTKQATADGAIYASFALFASSVLWGAYQLTLVTPYSEIDHLPTFIPPWLVALFFLLGGYACYRVSLYPQAQYGEAFKSVFDVYEKEIRIAGVLKRVSDITIDGTLLTRSRRDQLKVAWRYLHNYKVKCPDANCADLEPMSPEDFAAHKRIVHSPGAGIPQEQVDFIQKYYPAVAQAAKTDLRLRLFNKVERAVALAAVGLAFYTQRSLFFVAALVIGIVSYVVEATMRERQRALVKELTRIASANSRPKIYEPRDTSAWRSSAVILPHAVIVLGALLLIAISVGVLKLPF